MAESLIKQKTLCIITGASQGYGKCLAEKLASALNPGSTLLLLARNVENLQAVTNGIKTAGPSTHVHNHKFDQSNFTECSEENFTKILKSCEINVGDYEQAMIIHNAGVCGDLTKYTWQMTDAKMVENAMNVNVTGTILCNAAMLSSVKAKVKSTVVVNITSLAAIQAFPSWSIYCSAKAARNMFFQTLVKEDDKIRVLNWAPGPMDTDMQTLCRQCADDATRQYFLDAHKDGKLLSCADSVDKLITLLDQNQFENGKHIDFYDV